MFTNLALDTEKLGYFANWHRVFYREEFRIRKQWIGEVDANARTFKIRRTNARILKMGISALVIQGSVSKDNQLDIKIRLPWMGVINALWVSGFLSIMLFVVYRDVLFSEILCLVIVSVFILSCWLDLRVTEEAVLDYVERLR